MTTELTQSSKATYKHLIYSLLLILSCVLYYVGPGETQGKIMSMTLLVLQIYLTLSALQNRNLWMMVVYFFMLSYCYEPYKYYFLHKNIGYFTACQTQSTVYWVGLLTLIFNTVFSWFIPLNARKYLNDKPLIIQGSFSAFVICVAFAVYCTIFGKSGQTIIESGGYSDSARNMQVSSLFGYGVIPLALGTIYADSKKKLYLLYSVCAIYALKDILFGGRVDTILLCISLYMLRLRYVLSIKTTLLIIFIGLIFNLTWGTFRGSMSYDFYTVMTNEIDNLSLSTANSGEVYYASMRIYYMIEHGYLTMTQRVQSALEFLLSSVVPYSKLSPLANLSDYKTWQFRTLGGGLISTFIYAWGGIAGVIAVAAGLGAIIRRYITKSVGKYFTFYICLLVATCPRWYAYYPIQPIKFCVFGVLFFVLMETLRTRRLPSFRGKK